MKKRYLHTPGALPLEFPWGQRVEPREEGDTRPNYFEADIPVELESYLFATGFITEAPVEKVKEPVKDVTKKSKEVPSV